MNIQKIKIEKECLILSVLINNFALMSFFLERIDINEFSEHNQKILAKLIEMRNEPTLPANEILVSLLHIKGFDLDKYSQTMLTISATEYKLERLLKEYVDITRTIKAVNICREFARENENNLCGLDAVEQHVHDLKDLLAVTDRFNKEKVFSEALPGIIEELEKELHGKGANNYKFKYLPSFSDLFRPSNLVGIAGAWKGGKTTFGNNLICDLSIQQIPTGIISLEVSKIELERKILSMQTGIDYEHLRSPKLLNEWDKQKLIEYYKSNKPLPIYLYDKGMTILQIESKCRYWAENFGVKAVLIDYLGLIQNVKSQKGETRERELAGYSASLKTLAKELNVLIILTAQLNRSGVNSPTSSNLAESVGLARDCDYLITISKPSEMKDRIGNPITSFKFHGKQIDVENYHFLCRMDVSRHTASGKSVLLRLNESGNFRELETDYTEPERVLESIF